MLKLTLLEKVLLCTAFTLFVFGLTELGILADLNQYYYSLPDEAKTASGAAITVAGALAICDGVLCMIYAGVLTQKVWMDPTPGNPKVRPRFLFLCALDLRS